MKSNSRRSNATLSFIFLGLFYAVTLVSPIAQAQKVTEPVDLNARDPRLQEGKMFTLKLVPQGKALEIEVVGKRVGDFKLDDLGLSARIYVGEKTVDLNPRRTSKDPARFRIDSVDGTQGRVEIEVKSKGTGETFKVEKLP